MRVIRRGRIVGGIFRENKEETRWGSLNIRIRKRNYDRNRKKRKEKRREGSKLSLRMGKEELRAHTHKKKLDRVWKTEDFAMHGDVCIIDSDSLTITYSLTHSDWRETKGIGEGWSLERLWLRHVEEGWETGEDVPFSLSEWKTD